MKAGSGIGDRILLEDNHLILVNKLPGEIVQGDKTGDEPLSDLVKRYLKDKYKKPGDAFLGTVHRIDRPVSGVVIYAKTSKALERMNALLRERKLGKTYWAVTGSPPEGEGRLSGWLRKNQQRNKSYVVDEKTKGALFAELEWKQQATSDRYMMLLVHPMTGRHHQIRVLLAHAGAVIRGDLKYGARRHARRGCGLGERRWLISRDASGTTSGRSTRLCGP